MKKGIALFALVLSSAASAHAASSAINGWISDEMCGAKHAGTGAACAKKCIAGGEKPVFVDQEKKAVWKIDNPDAVKNYAGEHVTIQATTDPGSHSVHIDSIAAVK